MNEYARSTVASRRGGVACSVILLALGLGSTSVASATPQSFNYHGTPLLTGGVSEEERESMRRDLSPYNVWLAFVERDTGNFDNKENAVVDTVSDGPWLLAQLPPGQYKVRTADGQELTITAAAGAPAMTVLRLPRQR